MKQKVIYGEFHPTSTLHFSVLSAGRLRSMAILFFPLALILPKERRKGKEKVFIKTYRNDIFNTFKGMSPSVKVTFFILKKAGVMVFLAILQFFSVICQ